MAAVQIDSDGGGGGYERRTMKNIIRSIAVFLLPFAMVLITWWLSGATFERSPGAAFVFIVVTVVGLMAVIHYAAWRR